VLGVVWEPNANPVDGCDVLGARVGAEPKPTNESVELVVGADVVFPPNVKPVL